MKRYGSMLLCLIAALALVAMTAMPALAHHKDDHEQGTGKPAEEEAAADDTSSDDKSAQEKSSGSNKSARDTASDDEPTEDPEGKRYDGEGEARGETADKCTNTHEGNFSGSGANRHGPYDSTCDGSASLAGNGGGSAKGRPCAGCVGNADNKNPKGQYPDGNHDGNAGYECDANNGVGRSNPAHTGCQPPPPPPALLPPEVLPNEVLPAKVCPPGTAKAGQPMDTLADCDDVLGLVIRRATPPLRGVTPQVRAAAPAAPGAVLPFTGAGDTYFVVALGLLLVAMGTVAMRLRREES